MRHTVACLSFLFIGNAAAATIADLSNADAVRGLRQALNDGSAAAVTQLGVENGFFANPRVKIPLPPSLQKIERGLRAFGMRREADELVLAMNRAAEAAVPEAKQLLTDAVKKMSVQDAKGILTGGQTAGTEYFKRSTTDQLREKFLPIVKKATARVKLAEKYNQYAQKGVQFGLVKKEQANLDDYVTQKTLDGLFFMVAEEEKRIRQDPVKAGSEIIKKVFGALK